MKTPSRAAGLLCLLIFVLGVVGHFVPLSGIPIAGPVLALINRYSDEILMFGYGLMLLAVYVL